ncbi:cryptochrome/photolyase family protein [Neisseria sp. S1]|uniref:cryptochrome/photolyase family protein n=1 Tax=Neisseria sp. S1 TaxID=3318354 RepID=UPI003A8531BE
MNTTLVWFRRDLRLFDHTALQTAIRRGLPLVGVFVFDTDILNGLPSDDRRLTFIRQCLTELRQSLAEKNVPLWVLYGRAEDEIPALANRLQAASVVCAEDYEPQAIMRDNHVWRKLDAEGRSLIRVTDQVVLAKAAVMNQQGRPYSVFTPYKKAWLAAYAQHYAGWQPADDWQTLSQLQSRLPEAARRTPPIPELADLGFTPQPLAITGGETAAQTMLTDFMQRIALYHISRDFPAKKGVSYLASHLRFGTLSIRHLVYLARQADNEGAQTWLTELIWREFYQQFLFHHPRVAHESWRDEYRDIDWPNPEGFLERWQNGQTGYPIVDAAMRQLAASGYMHNRLRMITANFLVKDLLCDWRLGEAWFARHLLDFDLAANNGGWQWAASTGCDAQPYFRIFNPVTQSQKFDPDGTFIRRYVPELAHLGKDVIHAPWLAKNSINTHGYPAPIVDHAAQREKALALFKDAAQRFQTASDV